MLGRLFVVVVCLCRLGAAWGISEELAEYVAKPDPHYSWRVVRCEEHPTYTYHVLELTSQSWRCPHEVDRTLWHHWLTLIEPKQLFFSQALLWIAGGHNDREIPQEPLPELVALAVQTGSCVAKVEMIPNQSLSFAEEDDPRYQERGRKEDELIAYSWHRYLATDDPCWLAHFPMTKAVVKAMDALQEYVINPIDGFIITGASKRGWTAWTAAAVDNRVLGVMPLVIDLLNLKESIAHHHAAYGEFSSALQDYVDMGIPAHWNSPQFDRLLRHIEPCSTHAQVTCPKLIINASGDQFFLPDSSQFYFHQLEGPKYLRYLPNCSHNISDTNFREGMAAFYASLLLGLPLPSVTWEQPTDRALWVQADQPPSAVKVWHAHNPKARDFRLATIGPSWEAQELSPQMDGSYCVTIPECDEGWTAYFVELTFPAPGGLSHTFTTDVFVTPDGLPYPTLGLQDYASLERGTIQRSKNSVIVR